MHIKTEKNKSRKNGMSLLLLFIFLQAHPYLTNTYGDEHMPNDRHHFIQLDQDIFIIGVLCLVTDFYIIIYDNGRYPSFFQTPMQSVWNNFFGH